MVKVAILSFAHMHAYSYAACLNAFPDAELSAIWDDNPKRGRAAAKEFKTTFVGGLEKLLSTDIDAVIVTAENIKHRSLTEAAAAAGKWVLCEKPLATTVADAKAMIKACAKAGVGLGTAFPCRFAAPLIEARNQIRAGTYGEILAASCTNHGQFPGSWFADEGLAGGGAVMDHTVHVVDALRWIFGREFTSVYGEAGNQCHAGEVEVEDMGSLHLEMEGGAQISHVGSWILPKSFPTWGDVTIEFIGTGGVLNVDAFQQKVDRFSDSDMRYSYEFWGDNPDMGLVLDFVHAVRDKRAMAATGEDGLRAVEVTLAAYRSIKSRKPVSVG